MTDLGTLPQMLIQYFEIGHGNGITVKSPQIRDRKKNTHIGVCYTERCNNEQFLSIKWGCYNEHRCYNEHGRIPPLCDFFMIFIRESLFILSLKRLFMFLMCVGLFILFIGESLFIVFAKEKLFMIFKFTCTVYKS